MRNVSEQKNAQLILVTTAKTGSFDELYSIPRPICCLIRSTKTHSNIFSSITKLKIIMSDLTPTTSTPSSTHATTITLFGTTMPFDVFSATYAILVACGGILGYAKAKSVPSLAAGLTFGALIGTGSYLEATHDNYWVTFAGSGLLGLMMTQRFLKSKKFMPSGLVSALSIGMVLRYSIRTYQLSREGQKP